MTLSLDTSALVARHLDVPGRRVAARRAGGRPGLVRQRHRPRPRRWPLIDRLTDEPVLRQRPRGRWSASTGTASHVVPGRPALPRPGRRSSPGPSRCASSTRSTSPPPTGSPARSRSSPSTPPRSRSRCPSASTSCRPELPAIATRTALAAHPAPCGDAVPRRRRAVRDWTHDDAALGRQPPRDPPGRGRAVRQQRLRAALPGDRRRRADRRRQRARASCSSCASASACGGCSRRTATGTTSRRCRPMREAGYEVARHRRRTRRRWPTSATTCSSTTPRSSRSGVCACTRSTTPVTPRGRCRSRSRARPLLFTGDTLFPGGPGNTTFEGGDFATIIDSIDNRLFTFPAETVVLPGPRRRHDDRQRAAPPAGVGRPRLLTSADDDDQRCGRR